MTDATFQAPSFQGPGPEAEYHRHLSAGEFRIQRCASCGTHVFFPRVMCTSCGSAELAFVPARGEGTVYSHTTVQNRPEQGGPHNVSIIELAEGVRMFSRVEGVAPDEVAIGMKVRARIVEGEHYPFVVFDPVSA